MSCAPELVPVKTPRNLKQLRNMRYKCLHKSRISQDTLYNLHEVAYDVSGYMWKITTYPDLTCVFGMQELLEELDKVLLLKCDNQILSYDTTFQLGDFYVSPFIFRHTLFVENPCIPVMFLLHERKLTTTHKEFFTELRTRVPSLSKCACNRQRTGNRKCNLGNSFRYSCDALLESHISWHQVLASSEPCPLQWYFSLYCWCF